MPGLTITIPVAHMPTEADPRTWVAEHARSIAAEKGFVVRGRPTVTRRRTGGLPLDWDGDEFVVTWESVQRTWDTET